VNALTLDIALLSLPKGIAYLGSPYSKRVDLDRAFRHIARIGGMLSAAGIPLFCPIAHSHSLAWWAGVDPKNPAIYEALNDKMQDVCSVLIVTQMDGWSDSDGLSKEIEFFERTHKPIYDCDPITLIMTRRHPASTAPLFETQET
jgi:Domain of unknown function (DUF1937)